MALTNNDEKRIRDYLLGRLSDEEQQKIEERLMTDDDLFEELEISKGELIEEYRADELAEDDYRSFETNYLASSEGRERYAFTLALDSVKRSCPAPERLTWFQRLSDFFNTRRWAIAIATSAVVVALLAGLLIYRRTPQTLPTAYAFSLNSTLIRRSSGDARYHKVPLSPEFGELKVTLQLPEGVTRGNSYRAELDDRRNITSLKPASHDANSVLVVIPTASLREGLFALRLYAIDADNTERAIQGDYLFELVNPARSSSAVKPEQSATQK